MLTPGAVLRPHDSGHPPPPLQVRAATDWSWASQSQQQDCQDGLERSREWAGAEGI